MRFNFVGMGLVTLGLAGFLFGCSSSSSGSGDDGGGTTGKKDAAGGDDAGKGGKGKDAGKGGKGDDAGGGGDDAGSGEQTTSSIVVRGTPATDGGAGDVAGAVANIDLRHTSGLVCKPPTTSGACQIQNCAPILTAQDAGPLINSNAGTITVTGETGSPEVLTFDSSTKTYTATTNTLPYSPCDVFTVKASGGAFPAFSGKSGAAPSLVTLTAPMPSTGALGIATYAIDTTKALTWTWTGGSAGAQLIFTVEAANDILTCSFDAMAGTGTIPADVVAMFPIGTPSLIILTSSTKTLSAGGSSVLFIVGLGVGGIGEFTAE
jgi:hypothetical protein